ncbi:MULTISPECIES: tRNA (guanine(46)-N(7))-methyltransferase TrmB [Atopobiaceae]|uniref:tRNA (guanine(46)-N(7))-methyltransferase n=1 Tax=Parafannyhessea umbonata TaxID=604330 RepID=A0A1H9PIR9_9ACTN|nr:MULTISPECIES: methyltransferase domain-containing protein [Atopobiaceae]SEH50660.1 tRNA (guanine-N7-)-methyltransferase [Parafannyhessea umbonata]SER47729.1 tRNA (guanine-N7-)-methyltransferase [Parafannyhessea umbonata]SJZ76608.1 tRNA (guanine-N(7)-)-methyltransferase [Olsenella sp. KH1P3]
MHALHARLPKHFVLEERLERYADAIEAAPASYAGVWAEACRPLDAEGAARFSEVRLDMGCGKGAFTVEAAAREKDVLFVGIDFEPICIAYAAQKAVESGLDNVVFCPGISDKLGDYFAAGEVSRIYLNFPTPFPRKKEARQRLTYLDNLLRYRQILAPGGTVLLKTDSYPLWHFSQTQFALAGYDVSWESTDARAERPDDPMSWYEERLSAEGAKVFAIEAAAGEEPARNEEGVVEQTEPLSLIDYLPEDLSTMKYVPHGMQGTITNLRNLEKKGNYNRHL